MNNLSAASLIRAGRSIEEPFQLLITRPDAEPVLITIQKVLRLLPGRRIVAVASENEALILVKIFLGRFAVKYSRREVRGVKAFQSACVKTPALLWQGALQEGGGHVVAFEYLVGAMDLIDVWKRAGDEERHQLLRSVIPELARLHERGVEQNDIHPENFLILEDSVYLIDGDDVRQHRSGRLNERESLNNLSLFLAQFHSHHHQLIPEALSIYATARDWSSDDGRSKSLSNRVFRHHRLRKEDFVSKAFRECTRFSCTTSFRRFTVCERAYDSPDLQRILADPDRAMAKGKLLKDGNTATVALVEGPSGPLVIKRYNLKSAGHRLRRMVSKSRAWLSWANTFRLVFWGIRTVNAVAMVEERFGPLRGRAYFISEYVEGVDATRLADRLTAESDMVSMVEIIQNLSQAGLTHGDLKASNFLLTNEGAVILDLDSMVEHSNKTRQMKREKKDRDRFLRNWAESSTIKKRFAELLNQVSSLKE